MWRLRNTHHEISYLLALFSLIHLQWSVLKYIIVSLIYYRQKYFVGVVVARFQRPSFWIDR